MKNKANFFDLSKWRFGNQLLFVFFLIFLTTGVIVNYLNYYLQVNRFQNLIYHKVKLTRELLTSAILTPLLNEDFDKIERYLMNVVDTENQVIGVKLISSSGIILLSAIQSNGTTKIQYPRSPFELQLEDKYIERESDWLYIFPVKVTPQSPPLAWISLSYSKELLTTIKRESLLTNIFTFLAALIVNFLIIGIFSKTFQKDLNLITDFLINLPERYGSFSRDVLHSQEMQTLQSIANKLSAILKEQREKIYEEKNKLETIQNVIKEGLVVVDRDLKIIHFNKAFLDLTESPPQGDLEGVRLPDILPLHEEHSNECLWKGKIISLIDKFLLGETDLSNVEAVQRLSDGTERYLELSFSPYQLETGKRGLVVLMRNVTERKKLQKKMLIMDKLETVNKLAGGIAHDLNNYLASLYNYLNLLKLRLLKQEISFEDNFNKLESLLTKMTNLTYQLLNLSKGNAPIMKPANITDLIKEVANFCFSGSPITFSLKEEGEIRSFLFDENQMAQVFQNLFINSKEAMPEGGKVSVTLTVKEKPQTQEGSAKEKWVVIEVSDTGTGIPEDIMSRIFEPFFTTKKTGSGLGLTIVSQIIKNHGGEIEVHSKVGVGTTFVLKLPYKEVSSTEEMKTDTPSWNFEGLRILIVDDEVDIIEPLKVILSDLGFEVEAVSSPLKAMDLFREALEKKRPFEIVLTDYTMPDMTGDKLIKTLKKINSEFKAILSTGYADITITSNAEEHQFDGILKKPYKFEDLLKTLHFVIYK